MVRCSGVLLLLLLLTPAHRALAPLPDGKEELFVDPPKGKNPRLYLVDDQTNHWGQIAISKVRITEAGPD